MSHASTVRIAGYLGQGRIEDHEIIHYTSRSLKAHERIYTVTKLECLAVTFLIEEARELLEQINKSKESIIIVSGIISKINN